VRRASVATVLTAHPWEEDFVAFIRDGAGLRVVARAYEPEEVIRRAPDVVVVGSETSWISPTHVRAWHRRGVKVLGLHPVGDEPGRELFQRGGADIILPETTSMVGLFRAVQALSVVESSILNEGTLVVVTGPRSAPGRTEMALALAFGAADRQRTLLVDLDPPSIGIRLGLGPHPTLFEALDGIRADGVPPPVRRLGPLSILAGVEGGPLADPLRWELIRASLDSFDLVVADLGPWPHNEAVIRNARSTVLVCDAGPTGMVRAAAMVHDWIGVPPRLIVNRVVDDEDTRQMARRALGLEPAILVPFLESVRSASLKSQPPPAILVDRVGGLGLSALSGQSNAG
jgi:hypothetical protein